ncbi:MAG: lysylphosphatidylglycerol synthase transmembrane domain-containing protein [Micrococcaceae bacterium]
MVGIFIASTFLLSLGTYIKMLRWKMLIETYEKPYDSNLLTALSFGYIANFFLPFKIFGDFIRAIISGKKMRNGIAFSLATIIVDRILDFIAIYFLFLAIFLFSGFSNAYIKFVVFYTIVICLSIFTFYFLVKANTFTKNTILKICHIFNVNLELKGLLFFWSLISSLKTLINKINKVKLLFYTIATWAFYIFSYWAFSLFLTKVNNKTYTVTDVLLSLFAQKNLIVPAIFHANGIWFGLVSFFSLILLLLLALLLKNASSTQESTRKTSQLLPHVGNQQRISFLRQYFTNNNRQYIKNYLDMNSDIDVIRDFSAGSNATTLLGSGNNGTVFRKYAFGDDAEKLYDQVVWLKDNLKKIPTTEILDEKKTDTYYSYEMPYIPETMPIYEFVHRASSEECWKLLKDVLETLDEKLYNNSSNLIPANDIREYIETKANENIEKIQYSTPLMHLAEYNTIYINGIEYNNLPYYKKLLTENNMHNIFKDDIEGTIHGDLTMENIIIDATDSPKWYIIDPNTPNPVNSPFLDYAKLLQSLHGGYEFLMRTYDVEVEDNHIYYDDTYSLQYDKLFTEYNNWLKAKFSHDERRSIFYHEIMHWLRLMPYKINKDTDRAALFYAGMIKVLNDVERIFPLEEN